MGKGKGGEGSQDLKEGEANLFFILSVILRKLVFLIIWFVLRNVLLVSFLCVFIICSLSFDVTIIAEKNFVSAILF